jgi:hypothetical protein
VLGNPNGGDSGYIALRNRKQTLEVAPKVVFDLAPRHRLEIAANYSDITFDRFIPETNQDYTAAGASVGWAFDYSQRTTLIGRVVYSRNDPDGDRNTTNSYGLQGEWSRQVTDTGQAYVRLGVQRTKFQQHLAGGPDSSTTYVAGAGMNWNYQVTHVFLDATRTVDPNATGFSVERNQLRARITRDFTPLFAGFIGARAYKDQAADSRASFRERKYAVGNLGIEWRFLRAWTLSAEYSFTRQKYSTDTDPAKSNAGLISIIYEPHRETASVGRYRSR